jgi:hypothetical protein
VVHVDATVLEDPAQPGQTALEGGIRISAETSRRLACDASRVVMRHDQDGLRSKDRARTSRAALVQRRPDKADEPGIALPTPPSSRPRRGIPGRTGARRHVPLQATGWFHAAGRAGTRHRHR